MNGWMGGWVCWLIEGLMSRFRLTMQAQIACPLPLFVP